MISILLIPGRQYILSGISAEPLGIYRVYANSKCPFQPTHLPFSVKSFGDCQYSQYFLQYQSRLQKPLSNCTGVQTVLDKLQVYAQKIYFTWHGLWKGLNETSSLDIGIPSHLFFRSVSVDRSCYTRGRICLDGGRCFACQLRFKSIFIYIFCNIWQEGLYSAKILNKYTEFYLCIASESGLIYASCTSDSCETD